MVENLIGNTDHDHLGKTITYAAGLEARHAVLIAETFRPEHRSALLWLNTNSRDSVSFFGIALKLWRIKDSPPALQLNVVVQPDEWVRTVPRGPHEGALGDAGCLSRLLERVSPGVSCVPYGLEPGYSAADGQLAQLAGRQG